MKGGYGCTGVATAPTVRIVARRVVAEVRRREWLCPSRARTLAVSWHRSKSSGLDVEAHVQDVAVLDNVGLSLEPLEAATSGLRV